MSDATQPPDERRQYATVDPERFQRVFGLPEAHRFVAENGGESVRMAVIDTAIPASAGNDGESGPEELDVVARETFGEPNPRRTHGTKSAAVAAAHWGNSVGIDGVSSAEVLAAGVAPRTDEYDHPFAAAVEWAVDEGADVITMSFSIRASDPLRAALDRAADAGTVLVSSAGNTDGPMSDRRRTFPATHPATITVGATDSYGERVSFPRDPPRYRANAGEQAEIVWGSTYTTDDADRWVSAWGVHVPALKSDAVDGTDDTTYWWEPAFHNGTSAATPVVAGVVALVLRVNPDLTPDEVLAVLRNTGTTVDTGENIGPRVHAARAVKAADRR